VSCHLGLMWPDLKNDPLSTTLEF